MVVKPWGGLFFAAAFFRNTRFVLICSCNRRMLKQSVCPNFHLVAFQPLPSDLAIFGDFGSGSASSELGALLVVVLWLEHADPR